MKLHLISFLPLAGLATAFVIPSSEQVASIEEAGVRHEHAILDNVRDRTEDALHWVKSKTESLHTPLADVQGGHHKSNLTVYQLIAKSKYTTKLAKIISEDDSLVKLLNGTSANFTVFAPTDSAFEKLPDCDHEPSKELIRKVLLLHVSDHFYPAKRVLATHTIPSLLETEELGGKQRLVVKIGLKGLTINYFSKVVAVDVFGSNGVIHGIDSLIYYPLPTLPAIELTPSLFSTLALGLTKTDLFKSLNNTPHTGGTFFAPTNIAFAKLGPKVNAFLFSKYGHKYLKALLQYHVVFNETLYTDAYYSEDSDSSGHHDKNGYFHLDMLTQLEDRHLPVDVARYGPFINIRVNGYVDVSYQDGVARDGVIQTVPDVLIPPKKVKSLDGRVTETSFWDGSSELMTEDLIERLEPLVRECEHAHHTTYDLELEEGVIKQEVVKEDEGTFANWKEFL